MATIYFYDKKADDEIEIKHKNAKDLESGVYIVKDFARLSLDEKEIIAVLSSGKTVYHLSSYGGADDDSDLFFTGEILWKNTKHRDVSEIAGGFINLGEVPAGTLVMSFGDD